MSLKQIIPNLHTAELCLLRLELTCRISFRSRNFSFLQTFLVYFEDLKCDIDFSVMSGTIFTNIMCFSIKTSGIISSHLSDHVHFSHV